MPAYHFAPKKQKSHILITAIRQKSFSEWLHKQEKYIQTIAEENGFEGRESQYLVIRNDSANAHRILMSLGQKVRYADGAELCAFIARRFSVKMLKSASFEIDPAGLCTITLSKIT